MTFAIEPQTFATGSTQRTTLTVTDPPYGFSLKSLCLTCEATYEPLSGSCSTWAVTQIGDNDDTQASLEFAVPDIPDIDPVIGSSGTLTVTGTNGSNTQPIPVPCSAN